MPAPHRITPDELLERYDGLLLDAYGVLMTEAGPLPGARGFIDRLHRLDMPFCILTNDAAKLPATKTARSSTQNR